MIPYETIMILLLLSPSTIEIIESKGCPIIFRALYIGQAKLIDFWWRVSLACGDKRVPRINTLPQ